MSTLVGYGSSDEEDDERDADKESTVNSNPKVSSKAILNARQFDTSVSETKPFEVEGGFTESSNLKFEIPTANGDMVGPSLSGIPANANTPDARSPYSTHRSLIHGLTLPVKGNFDIPPSPPGSPPAALDKKFEHFLDLKKQGVHFNEKLARSSALKNPSLLPKLMKFAGVEERDQYATTLPKDIWNPAAFPKWAYKEELANFQQGISKKRGKLESRLHRESIEFVPGNSSKGVTPASDAGSKWPRGSVAERVMAGLNKQSTGSCVVHSSSSIRADSERRGGGRGGGRGGEAEGFNTVKTLGNGRDQGDG
ncbi:hypothetical protein MMC07_008758 [Pseudocyphellaria aurata]|nr:hypothetical protein [Pseudocyphellaria aurata]